MTKHSRQAFLATLRLWIVVLNGKVGKDHAASTAPTLASQTAAGAEGLAVGEVLSGLVLLLLPVPDREKSGLIIDR